MARKITKRQQQIYDFIRSYQHEKGYPPSVREMAAAVGLSSPSTVHAHLSALEDHGLIKRDATKRAHSRSLTKMDLRPAR